MRTVTRWATALATVAIVLPLATGCFLPPSGGEPIGELTRAEASQAQAIPDFDDATYVIEDAAELERLASLLAAEGVNGDFHSSGSPCPGSITTDITYDTADASHSIAIRTCDPSEFENAVTSLVIEWRTSGAFPAVP